MCTFRIPVHIQLTDIINAMIYHHATFGDPLPTNRQQAITLALDHFKESGNNAWATVDTESQQRFGTMCAAQAANLFPDLAQGVSLAEYQITRVVEPQNQSS